MRAAILRQCLIALVIAMLGIATGAWIVGGELLAPRRATIGAAPDGLRAETVVIDTDQEHVAGWWIEGTRHMPTVLLLHGVRANRLAMLGRARLFASHGYSVLLIDLPAHGESDGDAITLGWRESRAVRAARQWIADRRPAGKIGVVGVSLGGAAVLLGPQPVTFDAVVLEAVYSDARQAVRNRVAIRLGPLATIVAPLLTLQIEPRLGIPRETLKPMDAIAGLHAPVLVIGGAKDRHTLASETRAIYRNANAPKTLWLLPNAAHQDFLALAPREYDRRVVGFMDAALGVYRRPSAAPR